MSDIPPRTEYDNSKQRTYHDWAQFIIDHSRRVHMVSVLIGWGQPQVLHDIEELDPTGGYVGKFHPVIFRPFSPLGQGDSLEFALTLHRQSRHHRMFRKLSEYATLIEAKTDPDWDEIQWSAVDIIVAILENRSYSPRLSVKKLCELIATHKEWTVIQKRMLLRTLRKVSYLSMETRVMLCKEHDLFIETHRVDDELPLEEPDDRT